jgi:hypothetical protein
MDKNKQVKSNESPQITDLQNFKNINNSIMQDALNVWAELWAELDGRVESSNIDQPEIKEGFEPSCGWSEFLQKMWVLWYYLDFSKRLSQQ